MKSLLAALGAVEEPEEEASLDDEAQEQATLTLAGRGVPASKAKLAASLAGSASLAAKSTAGSSVKSKATTVITEAALEKLAVKEAVINIVFFFFY